MPSLWAADRRIRRGVRDRTIRRASRLHSLIYRITRGRVGARLVRNDMLLLATAGAVTGRPHTVPLLYLSRGRDLVVIASYGGRPAHPQWYLNLLVEPEAVAQIGARKIDVTARTASDLERAELWERVVSAYDGYAQYQSRTERQIPIVILEPRET